RIVANGTPAEVLTTERIEQVFGVETTMVQTQGSGIHLIFNQHLWYRQHAVGSPARTRSTLVAEEILINFPHKSPHRRITLKKLLFSLLLCICAVLYLAYGNYQTHAAMTFVVTNVSDSGPGSLRQAILDANANPGSASINFNIGGPSLRIQPVLGLPDITDTIVIDGSTQPGFSGTPIVELNGNKSAVRGLFVNAPGSTIRGLVINGF